MVDIKVIVPCKNTLGEGPLWDVHEQRLYWVDGLEKEIWRCAPDGSDVRRWRVPSIVGSMALRRGGGAVLALENGFHLFDFETGEAELICDPEPELPRTRLNDGKVDRRGRFIAGSLDMAVFDPEPPPSSPAGALYRLDTDLSLTKLEHGIGVSNGPCWSPDGRLFYFSDSCVNRRWVYDWDEETGTPGNKRLFTTQGDAKEIPDGATVDSEGFVWNALNAAGSGVGEVRRFAPDGTLDRRIELPVLKLTSVMFGGPALDTLFVTSMGVPGFAEDRSLDGAVFAITGLGVQGIEEPRFAG